MIKEFAFRLREDAFIAGISAVTLLGFVLRVYGLSVQPLSGDDVDVAFSAINYMERGHLGPTMWNHPDLRNILVYLVMKAFGSGVWGLKTVSLIIGTLSVLFLGMTAKIIFNNKSIALLAAFFLAIDPLHIDFSRQAVHEVYMAFFSLAGIYFAMKFLEHYRVYLLIISGILFGAGIASKWNVIFSLFATYLFLTYKILQGSQLCKEEKRIELLTLTAILSLVPMTVYLLTFVPWFQRGYSISEWFFLQKAMMADTRTHAGYLSYSMELDHKPYLWFLKPVAFSDLAVGYGKPTVLLGISNPFVWLLTMPSILYLLYKSIDRRLTNHYFLFCLFWLNYLPFLLASRPIWALTALSVIPFVFMAVAFAVCDNTEGKRSRKRIVLLYLLIVTIADIPLYLLATGRGFHNAYLRPIVDLYKPSDEALDRIKRFGSE